MGNCSEKAQTRTYPLTHPHYGLIIMPELKNVPDPALWAKYGIIFLHQVMTDLRPKSFQSLKDEYSVLHHILVRYLQLRHALCSQFRYITSTIARPQVLDIIMGDEPQKWISNLYYTIRIPKITAVVRKAKAGWERDVGAIDDTDWDEILMSKHHRLNSQTDTIIYTPSSILDTEEAG